ncbi:MAG: beta-ketoacyl-[acyl-carrier-protein] synthase family protein [Methylophilaceae bacterium]
MDPLLLSHFTATSCIGRGLDQTITALRKKHSGLAQCAFETTDLDTFIGEVNGVDAVKVSQHLKNFDCRNNRLAQLALEQDGFAESVYAAIDKYGPDRVGIFVGTSTSGILQTELAYRRLNADTGFLPNDFHYSSTHNTFSVADFTRHYFNLTGPAVAVSSACSSSAKVFCSAQRMMKVGLIDAAIVGGVDSLCLTTLYGFQSLELTANEACRPYDTKRDGISISEAGAFALLERTSDTTSSNDILLLGGGESSDAYHMSSPHPEGIGANMAMQAALATANLKPEAIDYLNLHGTATQSNDAAEGFAVSSIFGSKVPCSSTKGATGHALGAAGALEAVICALALQNDLLPAGLNTQQLDPTIHIDYLLDNRSQPISHAMSNSFGFGGTNCSLIFGKAN